MTVETPSFGKLKVIVVDDNDHMRRLLQSMLAAFGFKHVVGETNGQTGFSAIKTVRPDLLLTDFSMRPVDGAEFVRMIRVLPDRLAWMPVIMITGHGERYYVERARDAGVNELLTKPVTARDLYLRIVEVIERPRLFIRSPSFIGPDRRRKIVGGHPRRRKTDFEEVEEAKSL